MSDMASAIRALGMDPDGHFRHMHTLTRKAKIAAAEAFLAEAKKKARALMIQHHPDKGGRHEDFTRVSGALDLLERETVKFRQKMETLIREAEERAGDRVLIVKT